MNTDFDKFATKHLNVSSNTLNDYQKYQEKCSGLQAFNPTIGQFEASMTPYIIEERPMRHTQMDIFSRMMMDRVIWVAGAIDDSVSTVVQAQLLYLESTEASKDVSLYLDTPGGSVKSGLSMIDSMEMTTYDIATINTGMCASMGSVLLAAGTKGKRSSLRFSKVMTHQVSHGTQGHILDTAIDQREGEKYNFLLFKLLGNYSGKTWKEVMEYSARNRWFTADEAKKFGFIDEIIGDDSKNSLPNLLEGYDDYKKYLNDKLENDYHKS